MSRWNSRGLRGSALEEMINMTNQLYWQHGLAVIQKVPTPITPVEVSNKERIITKAFFGEKSTVDYIGVVQGIPICFDAKETQSKNLPINNIHQHQLAFMEAFSQQEGVAFLLVHFKTEGQIFFLPIEEIRKHYDTAQNGGRKSIPHSAFESKYLVRNEEGFPVHYLKAINTYLV